MEANDRTGLRWFGLFLAVVVFFVCVAIGAQFYLQRTAFERTMERVAAAGFVEKDAHLGGVRLHFAEGPSEGKPPLVLLHGQGADWRGYGAVLPELSKDFHVYSLDGFGHGKSAHNPELYSVAAHGERVKTFIELVVERPVYLAGHGSGGVVLTWVAANAPGSVKGVLLEDPVLFTTHLPRAQSTLHYADLPSLSHQYLASGNKDWVGYEWEHRRIWDFQGWPSQMVKKTGIAYHKKNPGEHVRVWWAPRYERDNIMVANFDPNFGEAFYTGSWNEGFDEEATLQNITAPTMLMHSNVTYDPANKLMAGMGVLEANRARTLIPDVTFVQTHTGHEVHLEDPEFYITQARQLLSY